MALIRQWPTRGTCTGEAGAETGEDDPTATGNGCMSCNLRRQGTQQLCITVETEQGASIYHLRFRKLTQNHTL